MIIQTLLKLKEVKTYLTFGFKVSNWRFTISNDMIADSKCLIPYYKEFMWDLSSYFLEEVCDLQNSSLHQQKIYIDFDSQIIKFMIVLYEPISDLIKDTLFIYQQDFSFSEFNFVKYLNEFKPDIENIKLFYYHRSYRGYDLLHNRDIIPIPYKSHIIPQSPKIQGREIIFAKEPNKCLEQHNYKYRHHCFITITHYSYHSDVNNGIILCSYNQFVGSLKYEQTIPQFNYCKIIHIIVVIFTFILLHLLTQDR